MIKHAATAIIGAGPAGSLAAAKLARAGRRVLLLDEKPAWEKPCGGGITHKAIAQYPFLLDAQIERNWVSECEIVSPGGRHVRFELDQPIAIFSRRVLNGLLLDMAIQAGAEFRQSRVTAIDGRPGCWRLRSSDADMQAQYLIIATGARNPFRAQFSCPFAPVDLMATAGYFVPGTSPAMQLQFLPGLHGYIWIFPRANHFSAGICGKVNGLSTIHLRGLLEKSLSAAGLAFAGTKFYAHLLPALSLTTLRQAPVSGEGWAMVGDAAGFTDPITGEGLYYALRSADILSEVLLQERPETYRARLKEDFLGELEMAARIADRFFTGRWMGEAVTERMVQFTDHSPRFRQLMCDMFSGSQGYLNLRQRLYRTLPAMVAESACSACGLRGRGSRLTVSKAS
jgi:geranylgeranyl diphosphate/geranylgeranyl-bacteriochlorophyllide a reductase